jgi:hypothetical protein
MVLLPLALLFSSCMSVQRSFTLNGDGSGVYALSVGVRYPTPGDPSSIPANNRAALDTFGARVQQQGGDFTRSDANGYAYWTYTRPFSSVSQADSFLQQDPRQDDATHFAVLYHDHLHVATQSGLFGATTYHVTGTISLADLTGNAAQYWRDATETFTVTMAGGLSGHSGGTQDGASVTYTIGYNQSATVDVTGNGSPGGAAGTAVFLAFLAVVLAGLGVYFLRGAARSTATRSR